MAYPSNDQAPTWIDLLRHGEPEGGRRYRGQQDDPLSDRGWQQMRQAVHRDDHWDSIISSPLKRCRAFAEELSADRHIPLHIEPDFAEIHFGNWEGRTMEQIAETEADALAAFWADGLNNPPPGGENVGAFGQRVAAAWDRWVDRLRGQRILLVCHGGVIRMTMAHVLEPPPQTMMARLQVPYACRSRIRVDDTPHGRLRCLLMHGSRK